VGARLVGGDAARQGQEPVVVSFIAIDQAGTPALLASIESLTIEPGAAVRWIGARPVIVASWAEIDVAGTIDVGSHDRQSVLICTNCAFGAMSASRVGSVVR
jgi:hypothetical protein